MRKLGFKAWFGFRVHLVSWVLQSRPDPCRERRRTKRVCITRDDRYMQVDYVFFYIDILVYARFVLPILFYSFRLYPTEIFLPQKQL